MRVVLSGGGTGGHIYPALALKKIWEKRYPQSEFIYIGSKNGLESKIVPDQDIALKTIDIQGFKRSLSLSNAQTVYKFLRSVGQSKRILKKFKPDVVLGTGGFVCGPVLYAASRLNIPSVVHEQNSVPGLTNKFLARFVDKIGLSFKEAAPFFKNQQAKLAYTGNPRAQEVAGMSQSDVLEQFGLDSQQATLLIFGGSRGALKINELVFEAAEELKQANYQTLFACGQDYYDQLDSNTKDQLDSKNFKLVPYISNMPEVFANTSLVVCRSGATTLAEITALGLPAILIPSPNVTNDHQTKNAKALEKNGAAKLLSESELNLDQFLYDINQLMNQDRLRQSMAQAAYQMGVQDAGDRLVKLMVEAIENK